MARGSVQRGRGAGARARKRSGPGRWLVGVGVAAAVGAMLALSRLGEGPPMVVGTGDVSLSNPVAPLDLAELEDVRPVPPETVGPAARQAPAAAPRSVITVHTRLAWGRLGPEERVRVTAQGRRWRPPSRRPDAAEIGTIGGSLELDVTGLEPPIVLRAGAAFARIEEPLALEAPLPEAVELVLWPVGKLVVDVRELPSSSSTVLNVEWEAGSWGEDERTCFLQGPTRVELSSLRPGEYVVELVGKKDAPGSRAVVEVRPGEIAEVTLPVHGIAGVPAEDALPAASEPADRSGPETATAVAGRLVWDDEESPPPHLGGVAIYALGARFDGCAPCWKLVTRSRNDGTFEAPLAPGSHFFYAAGGPMPGVGSPVPLLWDTRGGSVRIPVRRASASASFRVLALGASGGYRRFTLEIQDASGRALPAPASSREWRQGHTTPRLVPGAYRFLFRPREGAAFEEKLRLEPSASLEREIRVR